MFLITPQVVTTVNSQVATSQVVNAHIANGLDRVQFPGQQMELKENRLLAISSSGGEISGNVAGRGTADGQTIR